MTVLAWSGAVGAVLFVVVFTVDGLTRPDYRPTYHTVSALSLGLRGRVQVGNFVVSGALIAIGSLGTAVGSTSVSGLLGSVTVGIAGLGLIASGVWSMEPMRDYPAGAETPAKVGRAHLRHDNAGAVVFAALPLAPFIWAWYLWNFDAVGLAVYSVFTGIVAVTASGRFAVAWENDHPRTGAIQRLMLVVVCAWIVVVYVHVGLGA